MRPLEKVESVAQEQADGEPFFKPRGLWFSVEGNDDGWKAWCEGERFGLPNLARQTEIIFHDSARILRLSSPGEIDAFTEEYGIHAGVFAQMGMRKGFVIDWSKLARTHDAIIISPYQWQRRMADHTLWYYTWDCASGCVWNADAIKELVPLPSALDRAAE